MVRSWTTIPQVTGFDKADITDLEVWRKKYGKKAEAAGGKLTPTAIVLKIAAAALRKFPIFNTSFDAGANEIIYKHYCHIGVAVDTPRGLLVPVVRDVDQKNMIELAVAGGGRRRPLPALDLRSSGKPLPHRPGRLSGRDTGSRHRRRTGRLCGCL